jgi:hypothetical protein
MTREGQSRSTARKLAALCVMIAAFLLAATLCVGAPEVHAPLPNIFRPESTPAD